MNELFNEIKLIEFINNKNELRPLPIIYNVAGIPHNMLLSKVYTGEDNHILIYDYSNIKLDKLSDVTPNKKIVFCGIYFADLNCFAYDEKYKHSEIFKGCKQLKVHPINQTFDGIYEEASKELNRRKKEILNKYKNNELTAKQYQFVRPQVKRNLIRGNESIPDIVVKATKFKKEQNLETLHSYLLDRKSYIETLINKYIKNNSRTLLKDVATYNAHKELIYKLKDNEKIKKSQKVHEVLKRNEDNGINEVVVKTNEGLRFHVANNLEIFGRKVRVGTLGNNVEVDHIKSIFFEIEEILV